MKTAYGDLWTRVGQVYIVIPTNKQGIMGRGVAQQAKIRFPGLEALYKESCKNDPFGRCFVLNVDRKLVLLPVKNKFWERADLGLIREGILELTLTCSMLKIKDIRLPLLGCGFGERTKEEVLPMLEAMLDDRFTLVLPDASVSSKYKETFKPGSRTDRLIAKIDQKVK